MSSFLCEKGRNAKAMAIFQQARVHGLGDAGRKRRGLPTCHKPPHRSHYGQATRPCLCLYV